MRFDGQDSDEFSRWESERQGSQDSTTKDSGIDTSSTFTSSEDSNRGDGPKVVCSLFFVFKSLHHVMRSSPLLLREFEAFEKKKEFFPFHF